MFSRLYLHIPWCRSKCHYCAFISKTGSPAELAETCELLTREMELAPASNGPLASVYLGGGTPSLLEPGQVKQLLDRSRQIWGHQPDVEITIETNPGTVTLNSLTGYRQAGVNRISLGIQSMHDQTLALLGRPHLVKESISAFEMARKAGFDNIGIDLICGLPHQTVELWQADLDKVIRLQPEHISAYSLSIEPGTPFASRYADNEDDLPDHDQTATMLELADQTLCNAGYEHYEIANFSLPGRSSRHNSGYWLRDGYLGLGPSAHSFLCQGWGTRFSNPEDYQQWRHAVLSGRGPCIDSPPLTADEALSEKLFLGLRMAAGISPDECVQQFGMEAWQQHANSIAWLLDNGLLIERDNRIALTKRGMLLSNQVFVRFV